jgi:hypothetical protein
VLAALFPVPGLSRAEEKTKEYPECNRKPTDADSSAAKGAFQAGKVSFDEADYTRAIEYWEDAFRRDCTANILLQNLARAYELNGQKRQALIALEAFLSRSPDPSQKDQISKRVEKLKAQIAAEDANTPAPQNTTTQTTAQSGNSTPETSTVPVDTGKAAAEPTGSRPVLPLIVVGAGGAIALVGGIVAVNASKQVSDYEALCSGRVCSDTTIVNKANDARSRETIGVSVAVIGVAVVGGGLLWYFLSPRSKKMGTAQTIITPVAGPGFAGFAATGRF